MTTPTNTKRSSRSLLLFVAGLAVGAAAAAAFLLSPLGASLLSPAPMAMGHDHAEHAGGLWTCGMHPNVIQDQPGQCPICGMDLVPLKGSGSAESAAATPAAEHEHGGLWTCGMHPNVIQDQPGQCPICGMDLVPLKGSGGEAAPAAAAAGERKILFYRSPMDPAVTSPVPRKDSMGMDFVPVYADQAEAAAGQGATVTISPEVVQNMNVTTTKVSRRDITRQIRTVGYLDYDQELMVSVTTKYNGFIEKTYVNYVGEPVRRGQPLFEIYSPELVQTEQELLSALRYAETMKNAGNEPYLRAKQLLEAARERLRLWDITDEQIARLEQTGSVFRTLKVVSPADGVVMKRMPGLEGMATRPGMELLHIADLSSLWLTVEVFEDQLSWVNVGSEAQIRLSYFPGEAFRGKVRFIEPEVSEKTRTIRLTLEVPNPKQRLRVGMYATVLFEPVAAKNALTVPSLAVLRTGQRNAVIVALGDGRFAPREVTLGPGGDGYVQILSGLEDGAEVVTSSQFLIDSESNLREAIEKMIAERREQAAAKADSPVGE